MRCVKDSLDISFCKVLSISPKTVLNSAFCSLFIVVVCGEKLSDEGQTQIVLSVCVFLLCCLRAWDRVTICFEILD